MHSFSIQQIQTWKNDRSYSAGSIPHIIQSYLSDLRTLPDRISTATALYDYLLTIPEFLCHSPKFLVASQERGKELLSELSGFDPRIERAKQSIQAYMDMALYIELI
jgi:hypothetical protein